MDLKEEYRKTGLSQQEFSELVGISRMTLNRYMKGETEPDAKTIGKIAKNLVEFRIKNGDVTEKGVTQLQKNTKKHGENVTVLQKTDQKQPKNVTLLQPKINKNQTFVGNFNVP